MPENEVRKYIVRLSAEERQALEAVIHKGAHPASLTARAAKHQPGRRRGRAASFFCVRAGTKGDELLEQKENFALESPFAFAAAASWGMVGAVHDG